MPKYVAPRNPGLQIIARKEVIQRYPDGTSEMVKPPLVVEFGRFGAAHVLTEVDEQGRAVPKIASPAAGLPGVPYQTFEFQGGFIDTDQLIKQKMDEGVWDEDDAEIVLRRLHEAVSNPNSPLFDGRIQEFEEEHPGPPWPTYDEMEPAFIPEFATNAGLIIPAYYYEHATKKRPELLKALEQAAHKQEQASSMEAPTAA